MPRNDHDKIKTMLHAYELGMLSDDERREVELHLMECDICAHELEQMESPARLLSHGAEVRQTVKSADKITRSVRKSSRARRWFTLVPSSVVILIILLLLTLKDWQIDIKTHQEAVAEENRVAVINFINLADKTDSLAFGEILPSLITTDLSQSSFIQVLSSQGISDIARKLGYDPDKIDSTQAEKLGREVKSKWLITGHITSMRPKLEIAAQISDNNTGKVISSRVFQKKSDYPLFDLADEISLWIKKSLPLPSQALSEKDRHVDQFTTRSLKAYRAYIEGLKLFNQFYYAEAEDRFDEVIRLDSTFTMAYYYLARITNQVVYLDKALANLSSASPRDQYYIKAFDLFREQKIDSAVTMLRELVKHYPDEKDALFQLGQYLYTLGDYEQAIEYLEQVTSIDPDYKTAYNLLSYAYEKTGNLDKALEANDKYIELAPFEANPYDSRGEILSKNGRVEEAIAAYEKAIENKPDFYNSHWQLWHLYLAHGDYDKARHILDILVSSKRVMDRSAGRTYRACLPLYQGKFYDALRILDDGIAADRIEKVDTTCNNYFKHFLKAIILIQIDSTQAAYSELSVCRAFFDKFNYPQLAVYRSLHIPLFAEVGNFGQVDSELVKLNSDLTANHLPMSHYRYARGASLLFEGDAESALSNLVKAADSLESYYVKYMLARAYLANGLYKKAIDEFDNVVNTHTSWRGLFSYQSLLAHFYLGVALEADGQYDRAVTQLEKFLTILKNSQYETHEMIEARAMLDKLEHQP